MAWRVKAIPKAARYRPDSPQAMFSWHKTKEESQRGAKICRGLGIYRSVKVEQEEE